ncbi:MFS general substrate transporter [Meredithblackwellia eburnea MCA 4105]
MVAEVSKTQSKTGDSSFHGEIASKAGSASAVERVIVTEEDDKRICRATDKRILTILCLVYFLQILDKSVIGYSAVFGLKTNAHLVGNQYSMIGSIGYYAQLGAQPLSAYLLVKFNLRWFLPLIVLCWGASLCGMAGSTNYKSLLATRFLLGFFEAGCLPIFSMMTSMWYRRSEQPIRVAAWYGTNGLATILGSILVYGLGHIHSTKIHSYQIIFLVFGIITVFVAPLVWLLIDNSVEEARFLSEEDKKKAVERLRANNTGIVSSEFKWAHIWECLYDPKTYPFIAMTLLVNCGAATSNVFGPLLLQGIAGFSSYTTTLLNIPFGVLQLIMILSASYFAYKRKHKSPILALYMVPVVIGCALLYTLPHTKKNEGPLLLGYYLLSFLFAANPLIISWIVSNTGGQTKKAALISIYNAASSAGNIIGPQLFKSTDAPTYANGMKAVLAIFCVLIFIIGVQVVILFFLNKRKDAQRVAQGLPKRAVDMSMSQKFSNAQEIEFSQPEVIEDKSDFEEIRFQYLY